MDDSIPATGGHPTHHTVNGFIVADGIDELLDFLGGVFGATEVIEARSPDVFAGDGALIHAETRIGDSTLLLCDRKTDWPFTPALTQVYVDDAHATLRRATDRGAEVVTEVSPFYGGYDIARFSDPWHNLWWLFSPTAEGESGPGEWDEPTWEAPSEPDPVYTSIVEAMRGLTDHRG